MLTFSLFLSTGPARWFRNVIPVRIDGARGRSFIPRPWCRPERVSKHTDELESTCLVSTALLPNAIHF